MYNISNSLQCDFTALYVSVPSRFRPSSVQFSYYINNRQPNGSLSNVLSKLAVGVRVVGDGETQRKEHEREGDQEETRHRVLACVPSEYR